MGYLFLFFALFFGLIKAYCGKKSASGLVHPSDAFAVNTIRMVFCLLIGIIMAVPDGENMLIFSDRQTILISLFSGFSMGAFVVCWFLCVSNTAYMVVEVFVMGGVVVPLILCNIFYKEHIGIMQLIGIAMLLVAVYCMCTYGKTEKIKISPKGIILLVLCALSSGMTDFSQKLYIKEIENASIVIFNLYTYFFATIILLIACFIFRAIDKRKHDIRQPIQIIKPILIYIGIMAVCLFLNSFFKTLSAKHLDAVLLYPLNQGTAVVLALIMSVVIFKERINKKGISGIVLALFSVILINVFK